MSKEYFDQQLALIRASNKWHDEQLALVMKERAKARTKAQKAKVDRKLTELRARNLVDLRTVNQLLEA